MPAPSTLAAIDAGSNAVRLVIARAQSSFEVRVLETERFAVRLGHHAFTRRKLDSETIARAVKVFRRIRELLDRYAVEDYRAVATSAVREARNRRKLLERIRRRTGIELEVISGREEARLVCQGVGWALGDEVSPGLIVDLGGGSLELNQMQRGRLEKSLTLPLGTVRLMETYGLDGPMGEEEVQSLSRHVLSVLQARLPRAEFVGAAPRARPLRRGTRGAVAVCGGNAEALARLVPGVPRDGFPTLNVRQLRDRVWHIAGLSLRKRMKVFGVRKDRADVMAIAAVVFVTLGRWLRLDEIVVPGVGVREGVLCDLVAARHGPATRGWAGDRRRERELLVAARRFAHRHAADAAHGEQVRRLALALFDQTKPLHHMRRDMRLAVELAAVVHDIGRFVGTKAHHKHGEYLVRYGAIEGVPSRWRDLLACLVRYHNNKSEPDASHDLYASFDRPRQRQIRHLAALLRIADGLDDDYRQAVRGVEVELRGKTVLFKVRGRSAKRASREAREGGRRKAELFEREFGRRAVFTQVSGERRRALE